MHLILPRLRNIPVLAKEAAHVAACRPHAEHTRSRQKMIQRFLLDGIDLQRRGRPVTEAIKLSALIHANKAKARLSRNEYGNAAGRGNSARARQLPAPTSALRATRPSSGGSLARSQTNPPSIQIIRLPARRNVKLCLWLLVPPSKSAGFKRGGEFGAALAGVPRPSPRNSSCSSDISRTAERISSRPDSRLLCREKSQIATVGTGSSKV